MKNYFFILFILLVSCNSNNTSNNSSSSSSSSSSNKSADSKTVNDCNSLPTSFGSYEQAVNAVEQTEFAYTDEANTSRSSWIRGAKYYSCNNSDGYLIISSDHGNYIHQSVPKEIWESFKNASSMGSFYNADIKHRYRQSIH